jgi:hypothetical protein
VTDLELFLSEEWGEMYCKDTYQVPGTYTRDSLSLSCLSATAKVHFSSRPNLSCLLRLPASSLLCEFELGIRVFSVVELGGL